MELVKVRETLESATELPPTIPLNAFTSDFLMALLLYHHQEGNSKLGQEILDYLQVRLQNEEADGE